MEQHPLEQRPLSRMGSQPHEQTGHAFIRSVFTQNHLIQSLLAVLLVASLLAGCLPGGTTSTGPLVSPFQSSAADCSGMQPNQLCLLSGELELSGPGNPASLTKAGERIDLTKLSALHLKPTADGAGAAVLTVQAELPRQTPDTLVTLLAFGDVAIDNRAVLEGETPARPFTALNFHAEGAASGMLMVAPGGGKFGTLLVNGAFLTLGSSALVQTQAGQMQVATFEGAVNVEADLAAHAASAGSRVSVPLDDDGFAAGEPSPDTGNSLLVQNVANAVNEFLNSSRSSEATDPKVQAVHDAVEEYLRESNETDLKVQAVNDAVTRYLDELKQKEGSSQASAEMLPTTYEDSGAMNMSTAIQTIETINHLYKQCVVKKNPSQVYRMLRWMEYIQGFEEEVEYIGATGMQRIYDQVAACLNFELVFDSTMTTQSEEVGMDSHVHAQGIRIRFDPKTSKLTGEAKPLDYMSFSVTEDLGPDCMREDAQQSGTLKVTGGKMYTQGKQVKVEVQIVPEIPSETLQYSCNDGNGNWIAMPPIQPNHWRSFFQMVYRDLAVGTSGSYLIKDWKYTARTIFAEAIYADRTGSWEDVSSHSTTFLQLVHNPRDTVK